MSGTSIIAKFSMSLSMMLSYNSDKCVTCHNSGLGKYFQVFQADTSQCVY